MFCLLWACPASPHTVLDTVDAEGGLLLEKLMGQASSCVEEFNSSCLSSCSRGDRPLVDLYVELAFPSGLLGTFPMKTLISVQGGCLVMLVLSLPLAIG